tara:strand:- start:259 stop:1446 length:1188 start_codon:yes stop_codon:yes gene_type:complete
MPQKTTVTVLGATGSVGTNTVELLHHHIDKFEVNGLTANMNVEKLAKQAIKLKARKAVIADQDKLGELQSLVKGHNIEALAGEGALLELASQKVDWTMAAIAGFAGLDSLFAAVERGGKIAIANKEPLVAAGHLLKTSAIKNNAILLPVDSEHNAVFQCFETKNKNSLLKVTLTASGGPFLDWTVGQMRNATPQQAVAHPNWSMGQKISVDSATLMNKALEVIEAVIFFDLNPDEIDVVIHPQSLIHAFVSYEDGSILTHMGPADMKVPILHTLSFPKRLNTCAKKLNIQDLTSLTFQKVDKEKFPALELAYKALKIGQGGCLALNAANEIAVRSFLEEKVLFTDIVDICTKILDMYEGPSQIQSVEICKQTDERVRKLTESYILDNYISRCTAI